ncbi:MAG: hypothetical protein RL235_624 [Chlamydiota bacterium]|jgi:hypothetical protein
MRTLVVLLSICCCSLSATLVGNPALASIQTRGVIRESGSGWWSLRLSYAGDYVYNQPFHDEFQISTCEEASSHLQMWTQTAVVTFNIRNWIDIYTFLGASRLQIDNEVYAKQQFAWAVGGKLMVFEIGRVRCGLDFKYFQTDPKPLFFVCDDLAYNVTSPSFYYTYYEIQGAFGLAYTARWLSPYCSATYLVSKLEPHPFIATVRLPQMDYEVDVVSKSVTGARRWGIAAGVTIIDHKKATLSVEWRGFNQNSVNIAGELRF